jgi:hypothetical protein
VYAIVDAVAELVLVPALVAVPAAAAVGAESAAAGVAGVVVAAVTGAVAFGQ